MNHFRVKSLDKYMERGDRTRMPWVKWHSASLDDYVFGNLPDNVKYQAVGITVLAALTGNVLPEDQEWIRRKINGTSKVNFDALYLAGFIEACDSDGVLTAERQPIEEEEEEEEKRNRREEDRRAKDRWAKRFDTFWKEYPNKTAKQKAKAAWAKLALEEIPFQTIMDGLESHKQGRQWTKDNGDYIPHPTTFINGRRWEDEVGRALTVGTSQGGVFDKMSDDLKERGM